MVLGLLGWRYRKEQKQGMAREHDETKLPLWAQELIGSLRWDIEQLLKMREAHAVIRERDWFTVQGPDFTPDEDWRTLFVLSRNQAVSVCSLGKGDVLLVGRSHKRIPSGIKSTLKEDAA